MSKTNLRIDVLGTSFAIAAEEDSEYLNKLLETFKIRIEATQNDTGLKDPLRIAILTGYLTCDEVQKLREELRKAHEELQKVYDQQAMQTSEQQIQSQTEHQIEEITRHSLVRLNEVLS